MLLLFWSYFNLFIIVITVWVPFQIMKKKRKSEIPLKSFVNCACTSLHKILSNVLLAVPWNKQDEC